MSDLTQFIDSLENRVDSLLRKHMALKERLEILEGNIISLDQENGDLKNQIALNQQEIKTLKTANALLGSNDYKRETKLKINALIREIDACVVALSD